MNLITKLVNYLCARDEIKKAEELLSKPTVRVSPKGYVVYTNKAVKPVSCAAKK